MAKLIFLTSSVLILSAAAADCSGGLCEQGEDVTSLVQLNKAVKEGADRLAQRDSQCQDAEGELPPSQSYCDECKAKAKSGSEWITAFNACSMVCNMKQIVTSVDKYDKQLSMFPSAVLTNFRKPLARAFFEKQSYTEKFAEIIDLAFKMQAYADDFHSIAPDLRTIFCNGVSVNADFGNQFTKYWNEANSDFPEDGIPGKKEKKQMQRAREAAFHSKFTKSDFEVILIPGAVSAFARKVQEFAGAKDSLLRVMEILTSKQQELLNIFKDLDQMMNNDEQMPPWYQQYKEGYDSKHVQNTFSGFFMSYNTIVNKMQQVKQFANKANLSEEDIHDIDSASEAITDALMAVDSLLHTKYTLPKRALRALTKQNKKGRNAKSIVEKWEKYLDGRG